VVLGGHAVAFHGHPRATKDLDVLVRARPDNAERVYRALAAFGAPRFFRGARRRLRELRRNAADRVPPRRIDILNKADGITFDEAIESGESFTVEGRHIPIIGRAALLKNKRAAGRPQDLADIAALDAR
jgi:hypothetical protein